MFIVLYADDRVVLRCMRNPNSIETFYGVKNKNRKTKILIFEKDRQQSDFSLYTTKLEVVTRFKIWVFINLKKGPLKS